jgi:hypothetical protein
MVGMVWSKDIVGKMCKCSDEEANNAVPVMTYPSAC